MTSYVELYYDGSLNWPGLGKSFQVVTWWRKRRAVKLIFFTGSFHILVLVTHSPQFDFGFLQSFSKLLFSICSNCHSPSKLWLESSKSLKAFSRSDLNSNFSYLILNDGEDDIGENGGWCQYWKYPFLLQYVDNDHDDEEEDGQGWWWGWWWWWWWSRG